MVWKTCVRKWGTIWNTRRSVSGLHGTGTTRVREKHSYIERIHTILDTVAGEDAK